MNREVCPELLDFASCRLLPCFFSNLVQLSIEEDAFWHPLLGVPILNSQVCAANTDDCCLVDTIGAVIGSIWSAQPSLNA